MYYLTNNINNNEPDSVKNIEYIHVKAKCDGTETIIITDDVIICPSCILKTKEEAQDILNAWIDNENTNPFYDADGNPMLQTYINLDTYL